MAPKLGTVGGGSESSAQEWQLIFVFTQLDEFTALKSRIIAYKSIYSLETNSKQISLLQGHL